jgi:hypothetical protein
MNEFESDTQELKLRIIQFLCWAGVLVIVIGIIWHVFDP